MRDSYINAMNVQKTTVEWMNAISENLTNLYTPGYRENQMTFKTYLDNAIPDRVLKNTGQGKAIPGTSTENVYLEGNGYFVLRNEEGRIAYTRLGEFKFDGEGVYRATDGSKVQGYILNDKGEIMSGTKSVSNSDGSIYLGSHSSEYHSSSCEYGILCNLSGIREYFSKGFISLSHILLVQSFSFIINLHTRLFYHKS